MFAVLWLRFCQNRRQKRHVFWCVRASRLSERSPNTSLYHAKAKHFTWWSKIQKEQCIGKESSNSTLWYPCQTGPRGFVFVAGDVAFNWWYEARSEARFWVERYWFQNHLSRNFGLAPSMSRQSWWRLAFRSSDGVCFFNAPQCSIVFKWNTKFCRVQDLMWTTSHRANVQELEPSSWYLILVMLPHGVFKHLHQRQ